MQDKRLEKKITSLFGFDNDFKNLSELNNQLLEFGSSSVVTCDIFEGEQDYIFSLYEKLSNQEKRVRVNHQVVFYDKNKLTNFLDSEQNLNQNDFNKIIDIKVFNDGSLGSKTAFLQNHYCDDVQNYGVLNYQVKDLIDFIEIGKKYNKQVAIHSIGDASSLNCVSAIKQADATNTMRNKLIHFQLFDNAIIDSVINNNILVSVQPCFLEDDLVVLDKYVQNPVATMSYDFNKVFQGNNNLVSFSTDAPVCSLNPWTNLYYAINANLIGEQKNQNKAFDIYDAIKCYTENSAYSFFKENELGKIAEGYLADFIVLNQDIFSLENDLQLLDTKVTQHYISGLKVF